MPEPSPPSREERLAAKLRENLRRRKAQARAQVRNGEQHGTAKNEPVALSNEAPES